MDCKRIIPALIIIFSLLVIFYLTKMPPNLFGGE